MMSPHYSNFLKKPPLSNLSSNCSESVSVTIKIIKHKTQSAKPVGLTPPWDSVKEGERLSMLVVATGKPITSVGSRANLVTGEYKKLSKCRGQKIVLKKQEKVATFLLCCFRTKSKHLKGQLLPRLRDVFAYSCPAPLPGQL